MKLFESAMSANTNLLPTDGMAIYFGKIVSPEEAEMFAGHLYSNIEWRNDEAVIFGKKITTRRKVAWYGDRPFAYTYSGNTKYALPWNRDLLKLKSVVERTTGETFNSCLLNLYHDGHEGMAWHSDGEKELKKNGAIASLSFGAERRFSFKHKISKQKVELVLEHGSLLIMKGPTQHHWLHRLPPAKRITTHRINLTFRTIDP